MGQITNAIFEDGGLKPTETLRLREHERVRVTIESLSPQAVGPPSENDPVRRRPSEALSKPFLNLGGKAPARNDIHDRS